MPPIEEELLKSPVDYSLFQYLLFALIGAWGGVLARLHLLVKDHPPVSLIRVIMMMIVDVMTSGSCGVVVFWLGEAFELPLLISAALAGVCGHMGSRFLFLLERLVILKLSVKARASDCENKPDNCPYMEGGDNRGG